MAVLEREPAPWDILEGETCDLCPFEGPHAPGPHVYCDVCGEVACDYCGDYLSDEAYAEGDWRCPNHQPDEET